MGMSQSATLRATAGIPPSWAAGQPSNDSHLPEPTPVGGDDEKETTDGEQDACDNGPGPRELECGDLSSDEPDPGDQDEQEPDFGQSHAGLMRQYKD